MLKFFSKRLNNKKGFTLIELIVVIAILAILALIAIPRMGAFRSDAAKSTHNANVRALESAVTMYMAEKGKLPDNFKWDGSDNQGWNEYLAEWPTVPKGLKGIKDVNNYEVKENDKYEVKKDDNNSNEVVIEPGRIPDKASE